MVPRVTVKSACYMQNLGGTRTVEGIKLVRSFFSSSSRRLGLLPESNTPCVRASACPLLIDIGDLEHYLLQGSSLNGFSVTTLP